jgi:hypothetical protein
MFFGFTMTIMQRIRRYISSSLRQDLMSSAKEGLQRRRDGDWGELPKVMQIYNDPIKTLREYKGLELPYGDRQ